MTQSMIPVPVDDPLELALFERNDFGNGRRLVALARGLLKWVDDKAWVAYDGQRWSEREGTFRARMLAHQVAQHLNEEVAAIAGLLDEGGLPAVTRRFPWLTDDDKLGEFIKALRAWSVKSGNAAQTAAMLVQARDMPEMRAWGEDFDVDPLAYNVANGSLFFRKLGEPGPPGTTAVKIFAAERPWLVWFRKGHEPGDRFRQIARWAFDPAATCPQWIARLELVQPDPEVRACLGPMYGQTLTGLTDSEEFYVQKGRGGDGKTKTHEILAHGHGDYYRHAAVSTWLTSGIKRGGAEHRRDLVALAGDYRFILSDEPGKGSQWDGELIKQWTGGGSITASDAGAKASEATVFKPRGKLFVEVNISPGMPGDDKGFRRRLRLVPWLVDLNLIPGGFESPAALRERLWGESSGVLNWLIEGALDWLETRKVPVPAREAEVLADFWATGNPLSEWLDEECDVLERDVLTPAASLWDAFKVWLERNIDDEDARKKWNTTRFGRELGQKGYPGKKAPRGGGRMRRGVRLKADMFPLPGRDEGGSLPMAQQRSAEPTRDFRQDDQGPEWGDPDDYDPLGGGR